MVTIILTLILALLFIFSGQIIQALKKLTKLLTSLILKVLSFFGIKISKKEKTLKVSKEFKQTYKDIKIVKLSKKNLKPISSIHWVYFTVFIICALLVFLNLGVVSGNAISNWIFDNIVAKTFLIKFTKTAIDMNTLYTATMFSILSFSATKVLQRWKETKQQRKEHKEAILKQKAIDIMSTKELLNEARKKDEENSKGVK